MITPAVALTVTIVLIITTISVFLVYKRMDKNAKETGKYTKDFAKKNRMGLGLALGMQLGMIIGIMMDNIGPGVALEAVFGMALGGVFEGKDEE